jgi:hypothetical protein
VRAFPLGFAEGTARYGLLQSHFKAGLSSGMNLAEGCGSAAGNARLDVATPSLHVPPSLTLEQAVLAPRVPPAAIASDS